MLQCTNNPALVYFILSVNLCKNHQKQQKEAPSYFELETLCIFRMQCCIFQGMLYGKNSTVIRLMFAHTNILTAVTGMSNTFVSKNY